MNNPMTPAELRRYADLIVRSCVAFQPGDNLLAMANLGHRDLVAAVAESAYRAGAATVDVDYEDGRVDAARIKHASSAALGRQTPAQLARRDSIGRKDQTVVQIRSEFELGALRNLSPERVAEHTKRALMRSASVVKARQERRLRGTICVWPTDEWAARVFPELELSRAKRRLAKELLSFCRIGPEDPPGHEGWTAHLQALRRRAARLTKLDLKEVHIRDDGTDLRARIAPYSLWRGGGEQDHWGRWIAMNVPTEECFVSPDAAATEGTFRCSRPRVFGGRVFEELSGEFRGGRLVRLRSNRAADRDWLAHYLASIPNADRLGEIALVDSSSRIGRSGRSYYNELLDENAAAHIAFGSGFAKTRTVPIGRQRHGVNRSKTHIDVMIGTDALRAVGIRQSGRRVSLVTDGAWNV